MKSILELSFPVFLKVDSGTVRARHPFQTMVWTSLSFPRAGWISASVQNGKAVSPCSKRVERISSLLDDFPKSGPSSSWRRTSVFWMGDSQILCLQSQLIASREGRRLRGVEWREECWLA